MNETKSELMSDNNNKSQSIQNQATSNWFESWFDTKYYHILYKERNDEEAQLLMDNLTHYLNLWIMFALSIAQVQSGELPYVGQESGKVWNLQNHQQVRGQGVWCPHQLDQQAQLLQQSGCCLLQR